MLTYEQEKELKFSEQKAEIKIQELNAQERAHAAAIEAKKIGAYDLQAIGRVVGQQVAVHLIWGFVVCFVCYVLVIYGWRG